MTDLQDEGGDKAQARDAVVDPCSDSVNTQNCQSLALWVLGTAAMDPPPHLDPASLVVTGLRTISEI